MKITIKELRQLIRETIREQTGIAGALGRSSYLNLIRRLFNGTGTIYLQINNLPNTESAAAVIDKVRSALIQQKDSIVGEFLVKLADEYGQVLPNIPGLNIRNTIIGYVGQQVTGAQIQWGGSGDLPYGVVVVTIAGGENLSDTWKENFRRRAENNLKTISRNISVRLSPTASTPSRTTSPPTERSADRLRRGVADAISSYGYDPSPQRDIARIVGR
jgi:hypothetical protein